MSEGRFRLAIDASSDGSWKRNHLCKDGASTECRLEFRSCTEQASMTCLLKQSNDGGKRVLQSSFKQMDGESTPAENTEYVVKRESSHG